MEMLRCLCKSTLFNLTLLLQVHLLVSLSDNHFGECVPKMCANVTIKYPFYLQNEQRSYCGYPGFEVYCMNDRVLLFNISKDTYVIKHIWYESEMFQVINSALVDDGDVATASEGSCLATMKNLTFENKLIHFASNHDDIFVFQNCSEIAVEEYRDNMVKCRGIAVYKNDSKVKDLTGKCNGVIIEVPFYDEGQRQNGGRITDTLEKGLMLNWTAYDCSECIKTGGQCGFDKANFQFNCFCHDRTHALHCVQPVQSVQKEGSQSIALIIVVIGSSCGAVSLITFNIICAKRRQRTILPWTKGTMMNQNVEAFLKTYGSLAPKRYKYAEIRKMTNNFKDKLGEGGYGAVYKGKLHDSRLVAVKKLKKLKGDGDDFINEVVTIGRANHVNVVTLLGFCYEGNKRALVFEFLPNGSLEKYMHNAASGQSLSSETLFSIAVGIAKGLDYLHRGCNARILHFDIKPHNIILDEDLCPKISDFGLARLCPPKDSLISMSEARGTIGYIAPEVFCRNFGGVSHKSDVYSYGMMLLDMVCGRHNKVTEAQRSSEMYFPDWIYRQFELKEENTEADGITDDEEKQLQRKMIMVGLWCIQSYPSNRPPMKRVLEMLEGQLESLQVPPKTHLSSPMDSVFDISGTPSFSTEQIS